MPDVFFKLPRSKAKKVIREAMDISKSIRVDELDCSKSLTRQSTSKTVSEILEMGFKDKDTMWHFCIRYHPYSDEPKSTDIGLSTGLWVTYFLWIDVDVNKAFQLANKYKLKLL